MKRLHREEADRAVAEDGRRELGDDRALLVAGRGPDQGGRVWSRRGHVRGQGQGGDAGEHGHGQPAHDRQRVGGVAALGLLEVRARRCSRPRPRSAPCSRRRTPAAPAPTSSSPPTLLVGVDRRSPRTPRPARRPSSRVEAPDAEHREDARRRSRTSGSRTRVPDSLTPRRFISASSATRPELTAHRVRRERRDRRDDVGDSGRDGDRDGQDVVDQQGAGRDQGGVAAEVGAADGVRPAAVRVGVTGLPVGQRPRRRAAARPQPRPTGSGAAARARRG